MLDTLRPGGSADFVRRTGNKKIVNYIVYYNLVIWRKIKQVKRQRVRGCNFKFPKA